MTDQYPKCFCKRVSTKRAAGFHPSLYACQTPVSGEDDLDVFSAPVIATRATAQGLQQLHAWAVILTQAARRIVRPQRFSRIRRIASAARSGQRLRRGHAGMADRYNATE